MVCRQPIVLRAVSPPEVALPPPEMIGDLVVWDEVAGVFLIRDPLAAVASANDDAPVGRGLVTLPKLRRIGPFDVAPADADSLMRSLASWLVAFATAGAAMRWA